MKPFLLLAALIFSGVLFSPARAQTNSGKNEKLAAQFLKLQKAQDEAENKKDIAALDRIFADDFIFIAANGEIYDKKKFLDQLKADAETPSVQTLDYENFTARAYGKTAIVNYTLAVTGTDKENKPTVSRYRMSVVWTKNKVAWRIANFHSTRVRQ